MIKNFIAFTAIISALAQNIAYANSGGDRTWSILSNNINKEDFDTPLKKILNKLSNYPYGIEETTKIAAYNEIGDLTLNEVYTIINKVRSSNLNVLNMTQIELSEMVEGTNVQVHQLALLLSLPYL